MTTIPNSPEEERRIVSELTTESESKVEPDSYFAISKTWYTSWERYVEQPSEEEAPRPGPINNHHIVETPTSDHPHPQLRRLLVEGKDYVLVPQQVWITLLEWYNGGPQIPADLICFFLSHEKSLSSILLAKQASVSELYDKVCAMRKVSQEKACIWEYSYLVKGKLLIPFPDKTLEESLLLMKQNILLEAAGSSQNAMSPAENELPLEPSSSLPNSPEEERRIVSELTTDSESKVEPDSYFAISKTWYSSWVRYVEKPSEAAPRPGPINNHHIVETSSDHPQLRRLLVEERDYVLVPQQVWNRLLEWYNGGPQIPANLICFYVSDENDEEEDEDEVLWLAKEASVRELYDRVCAMKNKSQEKALIWDYSDMSKGILLNPFSDKTLEESGILMELDYSMTASGNEIVLVPMETPVSIAGKGARRGLAGLVNLGNTCFMNSALQCLAHTPPILDYFFQNNHLGMSGELAEALGHLLKELWSPGRKEVTPSFFKTTLETYAPQFSGNMQQDAHELLVCLSQKLHDSVIVTAREGHFKSAFVCPVCGEKKSIIFEPFQDLCLPLPLKRSITVTVFSSDGSHPPKPYTVKVPRRGSCGDLITALRTACCLTDDETLLLAKVYEHKVSRYFENPLESLSVIKDENVIVAYRKNQTQKESGKAKLEILHGRAKGRDVKFIGTPFVTYVNTKPLSGSDIDAVISGFLFPLQIVQASSKIANGRENGHLPDAAAAADRGELSFRIFLTDEGYLVDCKPLQYDSSVNPGLVTRILVEWGNAEHEKYDASHLRDLPEVYGTSFDAEKTKQEATSLFSLLDEYFAEEPLGPDNIWPCPKCKVNRQVNKTLDLWKLPEILVFQFKRLTTSKCFMRKMDTLVNFPVNGLDLSKYVKNEDGGSCLYELYAVSNHHGGLSVAHYTAYVKLLEDKKWYQFNDHIVSSMNESEVESSAAYLLFYRRVGSETKTQSADVLMTDVD